MDGTVLSLWRYPVKSMLGEELDASAVGDRGLAGDRGYALIDRETGKVGSAKNPKKWPNLFDCRAEFLESPDPQAELPPVRITLPDGSTVSSADADVDEALSQVVRRPVTLSRTPPPEPVLEEQWPDMEGLSPEGLRDTVTDEKMGGFEAPGTFFDAAPLLMLTTSTLRRLGELYPSGRFDVRRFRPNIVVELEETGFAENAWIGHPVAVGDEVRVNVVAADPRCVMVTLPQGELPKDPGILRTAAQHNRIDVLDMGRYPCVGVYAAVTAGGTVRRGDRVAAKVAATA